ncbi:bifunctional riboflavin kinase/FAD synthetase [Acetivibrio mesophilus]|uniref:Riboflavin biosynthesis protein n=1 Tax=Acetivibrio mesophilus TaxID=2487273 RepID=A0A4Q0IA19_9FIRM|nr:bifunctional riboflavin kinase/FAD synthetase [Acetivibrio mesophilus]ODM28026.1 riboflavin biosynthesis protein RibF [Clostridium sp. Bc-iso-3]RXE59872.1 bifunctional riboflavin kinase/FAD synthetase [Acetivibrio mesophilus]HHV29595.1 bifunctional riboflavin kinase/FAD synthetase [Clostridium sp.]
MKVVYGAEGNYNFIRPTGIGLGNFDGLHVGHMALINKLISESELNSLDSVVYTFSKHPENIMRKELFTPLITAMDKKVELLEKTRLDYLYFEKFDETFSRMKPEEFVKDILVGRLNMRLAVAGFNYRFGYRGQGDTEMLSQLGRELGFKVIVIEPIKLGDEVVSSTKIRSYILDGDMDRVFTLLGRHYSIAGKVEEGRRIGNTIGFPTANIYPEAYLVLPCNGVYITKTLIDGKMHPSITNVGSNPTFGGLDKISVETYILDFDKSIYGKKVEVFFIAKLRDQMKFGSVKELTDQIEKDIGTAKNYFGS